MGITHSFYAPSWPFYSGTVALPGAISGRVVAIGDHWYVVDLRSDRFRYASIPAMRPQQDTSERPGEQTLTVAGLWRRTISSWDHGAGQRWYDRNDADPTRFHTSRGVNPWERWELSMLPDVTSITTDGGGWRAMAVGMLSGTPRLVVVGTGVGKSITTGGTVSTITGVSGAAWCASNGSTIWVGDTAAIKTVDAGGITMTNFNTNPAPVDRLGFAKGRLIATSGAEFWDVIDGTTASPHYTHPWAGWSWTGIAEGQATVYACGYAGDRGLIYSVPIKTDGTGLDAPRVALELPHGELPYAMVGYIGFLVIGTSKGVRLAQQNENGALILGALVGEKPCRCLEPQDRFVWFGWDDAFTAAAGLGRIDLSVFTEPLAPAYATDLIGTQGGQTTAVITFDDKRWFAAGTAVYQESATAVAQGYFETGTITYNLTDSKTAVWADMRHDTLEVTESIEFHHRNLEHEEYELHGVSNVPGTIRPILEIPQHHAESVGHLIKVVLNRGSTTTGPVLTGVTLAAQPAPVRSFHIFLPLVIASNTTVDDSEYGLDVPAEVDYLRNLSESSRLVRYVAGAETHLVFVEDYEWIPHHATPDALGYEGTMVVKLKSAELTA